MKQFLNHWLETCARLKVRPRTYAGYKEHIDHRINPAIGGVRLHELSPQQVQKFVNELAKTLAPATVARIRATLRSALSQAERWSLVSRNVAKLVSVPKSKRPITRFLSPVEAQSLVNAASGFRLGGVFSVAVALGLRLVRCLASLGTMLTLRRRSFAFGRLCNGCHAEKARNTGGSSSENPRARRAGGC